MTTTRQSLSDIAMDAYEKLAEGQYTHEEELAIQRQCLRDAAMAQLNKALWNSYHNSKEAK